jgi:hypothetical protein
VTALVVTGGKISKIPGVDTVVDVRVDVAVDI